MAHDVVDQAVAGSVIHHLIDQVIGLVEIAIARAQRVGSANQLAVRLPYRVFRVLCRVGVCAPFAVGCIHRVGGVVNTHLTTLAVAVHRGLGRINGDVLVVHP